MTQEIIGSGWAFPPRVNRNGGLALMSGHDELVQSMQIILLTAPGQRVMRPTFGSRLHELVFAPNNSHTAALAQYYVEDALAMWEPRITVLSVDVAPDPDDGARMLIEIQYEIKATRDERSLVYPFYLIPES